MKAPLFLMINFVTKLARLSAIIGGIVLTLLAILMSLSVLGGAIAKLSYSEFLSAHLPSLATWLQGTGLRTIPAMYEIMVVGIAFVIFSFLPLASLYKGHAVVDIFTSFLPPKPNQFLIAFWETVFFAILVLITWRLYYGMERLLANGTQLTELGIPEGWGYAVAFVQMIITSLVALVVAYAQWVKFFKGVDILPKTEGAQH